MEHILSYDEFVNESLYDYEVMSKELNLDKIEKDMLAYKKEIENLFTEGKPLRDISQWSYTQREVRKNVPYMAIADKANRKEITKIWATPTQSQRDLYKFFSMKAPGSVLPMYSLYVDAEEGVVFKKRLGKGENNFVKL